MPVVADLHIHSRYSRACSREMEVATLSRWAKIKGVDVLGTLFPSGEKSFSSRTG